MMSDPHLITAAGNAVFFVPAVVVLLAAVLNRQYARSSWGRLAITGIAIACLGIALRIGQWLAAIIMREPGEIYAPWIFEIRHTITIISAVLFLAGCTMIVYALARRRCPVCWVLGSIAVGIVSAAGGYWLADLVPGL